MDLVADNFVASTAALQVSQPPHAVLGCTELCVVVQFVPPKGGSDWTDMRDLDLDLD